MVIGAYPQTGKYDLCRGSKGEHAKALETIPRVPLPDTDPVFGKQGPLLRLWQHVNMRAQSHAMRPPMRRTGSNSGTPSTRSTSMPATRPRTSGASPRTSARYAPPGGVMLDYGCGEALSADRVAEPLARLILCEPAPNVRAMLGARFAGNDKIAVRKPEDVAMMPAGSIDVIVMHSVTQYLSARELDALADAVPPPAQAGRAAGAGRCDPAQAVGARRRMDAAAIRRAQEGFYWAALRGLVRTYFSDYRRLAQVARPDALRCRPKSRPSSKPPGFSVEPARSNIGHNDKRMTFLAHAR